MPGPLDGLSVALFVNDHQPTPDDTIANYTLAALSGAGTALDALAGPKALPDGHIGYDQFVQWAAGAAPDNETVFGYVVFEPGAPNVFKAAERFTEPVEIANEGDFVATLVVFALPSYWDSGL
jgi:hypothetical protein